MLFSANFPCRVDRPKSSWLVGSQTTMSFVLHKHQPFWIYESLNQTYAANKNVQSLRSRLKPVEEYQQHYAKPNLKYFGMAQTSSTFTWRVSNNSWSITSWVDDKEYEVTPFLNSLYHSKETFAFSNVFSKSKAGKSDAETMIETGLFGLNQGSFMVRLYGGTNAQQAAPFILVQKWLQLWPCFPQECWKFLEPKIPPTKQWGYNYFFDAATSPNKTAAIPSSMVLWQIHAQVP